MISLPLSVAVQLILLAARITLGFLVSGWITVIAMCASNSTRATFIDQVLTSKIPGEVAKRFLFTDGLVAALYTLGQGPAGNPQPVVFFLATFPSSSQGGGFHNFGLDYAEQPVSSPEEAHDILNRFGLEEATHFRNSCRPAQQH